MGVDTSLLAVFGVRVEGKTLQRVEDVCEAENIEDAFMNGIEGITLFSDRYCGKWAYIGIKVAHIYDDSDEVITLKENALNGMTEKYKSGIMKLPKKLHFLADLEPELHMMLYYT